MTNDATAKLHFDTGKDYYDKQDYDAAIGEFEKASVADETFAEAWYYTGLSMGEKLRKAQEEDSNAVVDYLPLAPIFEKAYQLDPTNEDASYNWAVCLFFGKDYETAETAFEEYIHHNFPKIYDATVFSGICRNELKDPFAAIEKFQHAISIDDEKDPAFAHTGTALAAIEPLQTAQEEYEALVIPPGKLLIVLGNWADQLITDEKFTDAIIICKELLKVNPSHEYVNNNIGHCLIKLMQPLKAIPYFLTEIKLTKDPGFLNPYANIGVALAEFETLELAQQEYADIIAIPPDKTLLLLRSWADQLIKKEKYEDSITINKEVLALDTTTTAINNNIGHSLLKLNKPQEAIFFFLQEIKVNKDESFHYPYANIGIALSEFESLDLARKRYSTLRMPPEKAALIIPNWADELISKEKWDQAIIINRELLNINPNRPVANNNIGFCLIKLEKPEEAIAPLLEEFKINTDKTFTLPLTNMGVALAGFASFTAAEQRYAQMKLQENEKEIILTSWGDELVRKENFVDAITIYKEVLVINSSRIYVNNNIGYCYIRLGEHDTAIAFLLAELKVNSDENYVQPYGNIGSALAEMASFEMAEKKYASLLLPGEHNQVVLADWGSTLLQKEKYREAITVYGKLLELNPHHTEANNDLGCCYLGLIEPLKSIPFFLKEIEVNTNTDFVLHYENLGTALARLEFFEKAKKEYQKIKLPEDKALMVLRAWSGELKDNKKFTEAIAIYEEIIKIDPKYKDVNYSAGECMAALNRFKETIEYFEKAVSESPADENALYNLGYYLQIDKKYRLSIEKFELYIEKKFRGQARILGWIGLSWHYLKDYKKALDYYEKSISLESDNVEAYSFKAMTLASSGDSIAAVQLFKWMVKKYPTNQILFYNYGNQLLGMNLYTQAIEQYRKTLDLDPGYVYAGYNIGYIYEKIGQYKNSMDQWKIAGNIFEENKDELLEDNSSDYFRYYSVILSYYQKNNQYAEKLLAEGLSRFPDNVDLLYEFARINKTQKDDLRLTKSNGDIMQDHGHGNYYHSQLWEYYRKGSRLLELEIADDPNETNYQKLGDFNLLIDDFDKAIDCFNKSIAIEQNNASALGSLGFAHLKNNNYPEAIRNFKRALLIDPDDMNMQSNLAEAFLKAKNYSEAENIYQQLYVISPLYQESLLGLAELYKLMADGAVDRDSNPEAEEYYKRSKNYFNSALRANEKSAIASRGLTLAEISSINYSMGYINAKLYETQSDHPLSLITDSINSFGKVNERDANSYKANISVARLNAILNKKSLIISEKTSSIIIVALALLIFLAAQFSFFYGRPSFETSFQVKSTDISKFIEENKLDSLKPKLERLSQLEAVSKEELLKKLIASTPKPLQEIDMQMLANKAVSHETVGHKQIEEGFYALISFGSLLFIIAGLVLKQLSKLKVGTIELEKATLETASASVSLNIRQ